LNKAKLYLIPTFIDKNYNDTLLSIKIKNTIKDIDIFFVENIRTSRRHIKKICPDKNIDDIIFYDYGKHTTVNFERDLFPHFLNGKEIGIMSDSGTPCVADPGSKIVNYAHNHNVEVIPLAGPSSIILALMASGLNGQSFTFLGYLPIDKKERIIALRKLESNTRKNRQTQIFMETPYRNNKLFDLMKKILNNETKCCIASNIECENQIIKTKTIREWKNYTIDLHKKPTIFLVS